ncbi:MAG: polysaccharide biosynthesis protein [Ferruginibacter sp.]
MRVLTQRISTIVKSDRAFTWLKLISVIGGAQIIIQTVSLVSGILMIRLLPTQEYALYTLANTMLGTMTILADGGIGTGVLVEGGKVWQSREKLGTVLSTGFALRKKFAVGSLLIAFPVLIYLLRFHHASWLLTFLIIASLIPAFLTALSNNLLEIAPKLRQDISPLQKTQVQVSIGRFILITVVLFVFPYAFLAILAGGISQIWSNRRLKHISSRYADWNQQPDPKIKAHILSFVRKILPGSIYYCVSGQITIWIISAFGTTTAVAQVGALSRLSAILGLFGVMFSTLIVPRFARLPSVRKDILRKFFVIQLGLLLLSIVIVVLVNIFSKEILWVLGGDFSGLTTAITLMAMGSCITLISGSTHQLLSSRGAILPPAISISFAIVVQVGMAFLMDLTSVNNVLLFGIYTSSLIYSLRVIYLSVIIKKL